LLLGRENQNAKLYIKTQDMKILFVASEVNPILKVGGIADVVGSLSKQFRKLGHDVRVIIPFYKPLKTKGLKNLEKIFSFKISINQQTEQINIFQTKIFFESETKFVQVYLIENKTYLSNQGVYLRTKDFLYLTRFLFFAKSVSEFIKKGHWKPDIVHCHDWQAGVLPLIFKTDPDLKDTNKLKIFFTIHNLLIQGRWNYKKVLKFLELKGDETPSLSYKMIGKYGEDFNVLQQAILNADLISVVSPNYAKEIKTKKYYARGLETVIKKREHDIIGILNGIDTEVFNPKIDRDIIQNYSLQTINLKIKNKLFLQKKSELKQDKNIPLLVMITRLDVQKGVDIVCSAVENLISENIQFIFLGTGEKKYEKMLESLSKKYPKKVKAFIKFDAKVAQQIYAGGDMFLMPSRFEPCGLSQLVAMRYGNIPIVRETGGLANTVENIRQEKKLFSLIKKTIGTGFVFNGFSEEKFTKVIERALSFYKNKKQWKKIQKNAMKKNFSWQISAENYLKLYKKLLDN